MATSYVDPYPSQTQTPHGVFPSQQVSQQARQAAVGRRRRGENVATPVPDEFSVVPTPQQGQGRYGLVPGPVGLPDPYGNLSNVYPNLGPTDEAASSAILSRLHGELSPETLSNIENAAASFGVSSGMPGSQLAQNRGLRDIGLTTEQMQQQGLGDMSMILPMIAQTQTLNPALQSQIAEMNAVNAAAPNPQMASEYAKKLFDQEMKMMSGGGGGSGMFGLDSETSGQIGQYAQLAGTVLSLLACWVAREVYGADNPKWKLFRAWLFSDAPAWFRWLYLRNGERFAMWVANKPKLKLWIRTWMDERIESHHRKYYRLAT